jgi:hypothetical protein
MTDVDKLLLYVIENCRPDQVDSMLEISQTKGRPISVLIVEAVRIMVNRLAWEERQEVVAKFREEDGIDLEELLP